MLLVTNILVRVYLHIYIVIRPGCNHALNQLLLNPVWYTEMWITWARTRPRPIQISEKSAEARNVRFQVITLKTVLTLADSQIFRASRCEPTVNRVCNMLPSVSSSARLSTMRTKTTLRPCIQSRKTRRRLCCLTSTVPTTTPSSWTHTAGHRTPWRSRTSDPARLYNVKVLPWHHVKTWPVILAFFFFFCFFPSGMLVSEGQWSLWSTSQTALSGSLYCVLKRLFSLISVVCYQFFSLFCTRLKVWLKVHSMTSVIATLLSLAVT